MAPDLRGFRLSDKPKKIAMKDLVEDIHALITHCHAQTCVLIGHDWGGMIALCVAAQYPALIEKLIILNAAHPQLFQRALEKDPQQQKASRYLNMLRDTRAETLIQVHHYRYFWDHLMLEITEQRLFSPEMKKTYEQGWGMPGALTAMLAYYRDWPLGMSLTQSIEITVPTLAIWGEKDRSLSSQLLDNLSLYIKNLKVYKIAAGSHWVLHEFPEEIIKVIELFID